MYSRTGTIMAYLALLAPVVSAEWTRTFQPASGVSYPATPLTVIEMDVQNRQGVKSIKLESGVSYKLVASGGFFDADFDCSIACYYRTPSADASGSSGCDKGDHGIFSSALEIGCSSSRREPNEFWIESGRCPDGFDANRQFTVYAVHSGSNQDELVLDFFLENDSYGNNGFRNGQLKARVEVFSPALPAPPAPPAPPPQAPPPPPLPPSQPTIIPTQFPGSVPTIIVASPTPVSTSASTPAAEPTRPTSPDAKRPITIGVPAASASPTPTVNAAGVGASSDTGSPAPRTNPAAIAVGVLGGVAGAAGLGFVAYRVRRKRRNVNVFSGKSLNRVLVSVNKQKDIQRGSGVVDLSMGNLKYIYCRRTQNLKATRRVESAYVNGGALFGAIGPRVAGGGTMDPWTRHTWQSQGKWQSLLWDEQKPQMERKRTTGERKRRKGLKKLKLNTLWYW
ncbi:hypothetical protein BC832DRAFT_542231 [Gaertneriomyces semiglobifer]|nr:hypothetical protein BC832DRAFT_542231 [Gaertneriomyces semiglobifer]